MLVHTQAQDDCLKQDSKWLELAVEPNFPLQCCHSIGAVINFLRIYYSIIWNFLHSLESHQWFWLKLGLLDVQTQFQNYFEQFLLCCCWKQAQVSPKLLKRAQWPPTHRYTKKNVYILHFFVLNLQKLTPLRENNLMSPIGTKTKKHPKTRAEIGTASGSSCNTPDSSSNQMNDKDPTIISANPANCK